ncbi:MAG: hypothetical protein GWP09_03035 [Nitrospiraceae bacterium]|nr:hypothetical protein [Nitrospiraceae bacterium]
MRNLKLRSVIKHKRGGLELSVNSIVILIFAITLLSLGLVFIRNMFQRASSSFVKVSDTVKSDLLQKLKNSNERVVFENEYLTLAPGDKDVLNFAIRNELSQSKTFFVDGNGDIDETGKWTVKKSVLKCYSSTEGDPGNNIIFKVGQAGITIKPGDNAVRAIEVHVSKSAPEGIYYCAMIIEDPITSGQEYARKEFRITVQK